MTTYSRREVLRILTIAAGATALGVTGCSDGNGNSPPTQQEPVPTGQTLNGDAFFAQGVASGDPRQTSVILWTRVADAAGGDVRVRLQVARDEAFANRIVDRELGVRAADDRVLKVRITSLTADTRYFYRYTYLRSDGNFYTSPVGRTRTAPDIASARPVRFAFVSCQDYIGRFYNTLLPLLDQDLDFVVHLGDAIYETTGDPSFQGGSGGRTIAFDDVAGAIRLGSATAPFFAAQSLDNYRQLHRTYRADAVLKQIYQRFPVIAIWDDHEYSDDSWMSVATYTDGRRDERNDARRRNADRAWFEYMPIDTEVADGNGVMTVTDQQLFPNARIFRSFRFGRDVELFLTDYRSFRPDHLIPEDAFPGAVVMDRAALTQVLALAGVPYEAVRNNFSAYVNIDSGPFAPYKAVLLTVLTVAYQAEGFELGQASVRAQNTVRGNIATTVINSLVAQFNALVPPANRVPPISDAVIATLDTGIAFFTMGKTALFGELGSRYFVVKDTFDLYATYLLLTRGPAVQSAYGTAQDAWLRSQVAASTARWKFIGTSVSFTSMVLDLRPPQLGVAPPLNQRFYLNVDQWDGFPNQKGQYLAQVLGPIPGVVLLSGDIHASFATQHGPNVVEFTTPAISSSTFKSLLANFAAGDPLLGPLANALLPALDNLLRAGSSAIRYVQSDRHGVGVATADDMAVNVTFTELPEARALQSAYAAPASITADLRTTRLRYDGAALTVLANVSAAMGALEPA